MPSRLPQLYTLVQRLEPFVPDQQQVARIASYSIVMSLLEFTPETTTTALALAGIQTQEVQAVYSGLEEALKQATEYQQQQRNVGFSVWQDLREILALKLPPYLQGKKDVRTEKNLGKDTPPLLIEGIISALRHEELRYEDILRRRGVALLAELKDRGQNQELSGRIRQDYGLIIHHFTRRIER